ncbi:protease inhibitor I42 family protein [Neobacillus mesonae]|nr:protease inhibitor I42 family protein [Neobacillus mesonae]
MRKDVDCFMQTQSIPVTKVIVRLSAGEEALVCVKDSSGSSGYHWRVEKSLAVSVTSEVYEPVSAQSDELAGSSVLRVFSIKLKKELKGEWIERIELIDPTQGEIVQVIEVHIGVASHV